MRFLVKYSVDGRFPEPPEMSDNTRFKLTIDQNRFRLFYSIDSEQSPDEVLDWLLYQGTNLPHLVSAIMGVSTSGFSIDLYRQNQSDFELVARHGIRGLQPSKLPLFIESNEGYLLIEQIINAQLGEGSWITNIIISALEFSLLTNQQELIFTWSWWAFEWFLSSYAHRTGYLPLLEYEGTPDDQGIPSKLRNCYRRMLDELTGKFSTYVDTHYVLSPDTRVRFESDITEISSRVKNIMFYRYVSEHLTHAQDFLILAINDLGDSISNERIRKYVRNIADDWDSTVDLINEMKDLRNAITHFPPEEWLRIIEEKRDSIFRFRSVVSVILLSVLRRNPEEYGSLSSRQDTEQVPESGELIMPSLTPESGRLFHYVTIGGEIIKHETDVTVEDWDFPNAMLKLRVTDGDFIQSELNQGLIPHYRPIDASLTLACENMRLRGVLNHSEKPIPEDTVLVHVFQWTYLG